MSTNPRYWLMKSEPNTFSIQDLQRDGRTPWEGVRNFRARNYMKDMTAGDWVLFYHSSAKPPGVAGLARVCRTAYPDHTQFDPNSSYYDETSRRERPKWYMVDVEYVETFPTFVSLHQLKEDPALEGMKVIKRGQRLSVQPVEKHHFEHVLQITGSRTRVS